MDIDDRMCNTIIFQFLERMVHKYSEAAKEKGVYILGACGWVNFL